MQDRTIKIATENLVLLGGDMKLLGSILLLFITATLYIYASFWTIDFLSEHLLGFFGFPLHFLNIVVFTAILTVEYFKLDSIYYLGNNNAVVAVSILLGNIAGCALWQYNARPYGFKLTMLLDITFPSMLSWLPTSVCLIWLAYRGGFPRQAS